MKKQFAIFTIFAVMACFAVSAAAAPYKFGVCGFSDETEKQLSEVVSTVLKGLSEDGRIDLELVIFDSDELLERAIEEKEVNIFIHESYDKVGDYVRDERLEPFVSYSFFGAGVIAKKCTFVRKDSEVENLADLKGQRLGMTGTMYDFYALTDILGEKPYMFFRKIQKTKAGPSQLRDLVSGEIDGALVVEYAVALLKTTNPEMVTQIKMLDCPMEYNMQPIFFVKDSAEPEIKEQIVDIFVNYEKEPAFKTYLPLMKKVKIEFKKVSASTFKKMIALFDKAEENGWNKDYEVWHATE